MTEFEGTEHLRPDKPCSHSGTLSDTKGRQPACGNPRCTEPDHWFAVRAGEKRKVQHWFKRQRVLALVEQGAPLAVSTLAELAKTSPRVVRETLEEHGVTLPNRQLGKDGKVYSTTRKEARLRALRHALERADRYLPTEARCLGQTLLNVCEEVEQ